MSFTRWLTTESKGWLVAGPLLFIGIAFLLPLVVQLIGIVPRSTDTGLLLGSIALVSLVAGIVELLPRAQRTLVATGRLLSALGLLAVIFWMLMKLV